MLTRVYIGRLRALIIINCVDEIYLTFSILHIHLLCTRDIIILVNEGMVLSTFRNGKLVPGAC